MVCEVSYREEAIRSFLQQIFVLTLSLGGMMRGDGG